jgi:acyl-CoA thioesterase I
MASAFASAFAVVLSLAAAGAWAQEMPGAAPHPSPAPVQTQATNAAPESLSAPGQAKDVGESSLSPECRVPGSKLYTLAPLRAVKRALKERRPIQVLAIGSSSTAGVGASSPLASYPMRLEGELEKLFPGVEVEVVNRGLSGEVAADAADRIKNTIAEVEPDLVVWQVGTNDALARVPVDEFEATVRDTVRWLKDGRADVVLVGLQYTRDFSRHEHYARIRQAIQRVAVSENVLLVRRFDAMQFIARTKANFDLLSGDQLHLNDLGYHCMAEHVAQAIVTNLFLRRGPPPTP